MNASWDDHPWVNVTLTSDLVSRIGITFGAYFLYSLWKEFHIWFVDSSWDGTHHLWVTVTLPSNQVFRIIVS